MQMLPDQLWKRWGRYAVAAFALALLAAGTATGAEPARGTHAGAAPKAAPSDAGSANHAPPPSASDKGDKRGERGEHDDGHQHATAPNRDAGNRGDAAHLDRGPKPGLRSGDKVGPPHGVDTIDTSVAAPVSGCRESTPSA
jgi:hypothetical protein